MSARSDPALRLEDLTVRYPAAAADALDRVSLEIRNGELLAIAGPNGCGKTTLLRAASGVLAPLSGRASGAGQTHPMHKLPPEKRARLLAVVPQMAGLPSGFTVAEAVMLGRISFHGWFGPETPADRESVRAAIAAVGLESVSGQSIETLSGGTAQRVLIARALAQGASILLMDEPTAHLDIRFQIETLTLLRRFARERGHAVVAAMHDLNLVARFADRIALLSGGRLVCCGSPQTVLTAEILSPLFHHPMLVVPHPLYGYPLILPDGEELLKSAVKLPRTHKKR
ncbi:MAG: ABC transporter ATP-binding protein [Anaerolineales bacterium]|nr:ABC transporter ATP-binding protein [Anaerolineales bacterium]